MKRLICLAAVCAMLLCGNASAHVAPSFSDVAKSAAYHDAVIELTTIGVLSGYNDGTFRPDNTMTRAQFSAVVCRMLSAEEEAKAMTSSNFSDVPSSYWAVGYIAKASSLGIINGYQDGTFRPDNTITYAQAVKMLTCAWGFSQQADALGGYPNGHLAIAKELGITAGIQSAANAPASRGTVAMLAYNTLMTDSYVES